MEEFTKVDPKMWVPAKANHLLIMPTGPTAGRTYNGMTMELDAENSSWNSITSDKPFLVSSLPKENYQVNGWTCCYPPALLSAHKAADQVTRVTTRPSPRAWVLLGGILSSPAIVYFSGGATEESCGMNHPVGGQLARAKTYAVLGVGDDASRTRAPSGRTTPKTNEMRTDVPFARRRLNLGATPDTGL